MRKFFLMLVVLFCSILPMLAQDSQITIHEVFNQTSKMDAFVELEDVQEYFNFPATLGEGRLIIHGNAEHRDAIIALLNMLPEGLLVYDSTDERGRFDRMFYDEAASQLLYVHVGIGGNDTALILFEGGKKADIMDFINRMNLQN